MFPVQIRIYLLVAVLVALGVSGAATIYAIRNDALPQEENPAPQGEQENPAHKSGEGPVVRPHLRKEDRDALREENRQQERIGEEVSRIREGMQEQGIDVDIEKIREDAIGRLEQASEIHMAPPSLEGQPHDFEGIPQTLGACFRSDGSTTSNREECDKDQGQHLGFRKELMHQGAASPTFMEEQIQKRFGGSGMPYTQMGSGGPGSMMGPPPGMAKGIIMMMEHMMSKLPMIVTLFEDSGIPVSPDVHRAVEEAQALFDDIRPACELSPMDCMRLREVAVILESRMRPPMEQAMMASGNIELGMQIERMMAKEGMGPPSMMMDNRGPPSGYGPMHMGAPDGFDNIQSRMMQCMMSGESKTDCMNQVMGSGSPR